MQVANFGPRKVTDIHQWNLSFWRQWFFWDVMIPCGFNVLEEPAASSFRVEVQHVQ
jgi:hypothetical protein